MATLSGRAPYRFDSEIIIGDDWHPAWLVLTDDEGTVYDLTEATGVCQVRSEPGGALLATGTVTAANDDGIVTWGVSHEDTANLSPGKARYAVRLTFGDGSVRTIIEGTVTIRRSVISDE